MDKITLGRRSFFKLIAATYAGSSLASALALDEPDWPEFIQTVQGRPITAARIFYNGEWSGDREAKYLESIEQYSESEIIKVISWEQASRPNEWGWVSGGKMNLTWFLVEENYKILIHMAQHKDSCKALPLNISLGVLEASGTFRVQNANFITDYKGVSTAELSLDFDRILVKKPNG